MKGSDFVSALRAETKSENLLGLVLCGGQSSRMGSDKGLLVSEGMTWAERAGQKLATVCDRVVYSIRRDQQPSYAAAIGSADFAVDADKYKDIGPLGGLLSVHEQFPQNDILLIACDMIRVEAEDLRQLVQSAGDIRAFRHGGLFEPLCAYYSAGALAKVSALYREKKIGAGLQKILHLPELRVTPLVSAEAYRLRSQNLPQA